MEETVTLEGYITWFKSHERLLVIALVLGVGYLSYGKWLDKSATDAASKAAVALQVAAVQHDADLKVAAAVAQQTALFNQAQAQHEQEMASLVGIMASRDAASTHQIAVVQQPKTTPEAIADLNQTYKFPTPLTVEQAGTIPTEDIQSFTVAKIQAETATADLADTKTQLASTESLLSSATALVGVKTDQVTGLQTELKTQAAASKAEIASVKAAARKSKFAWFKIGFVSGVAATLAVIYH